jgi:hypothetical protein
MDAPVLYENEGDTSKSPFLNLLGGAWRFTTLTEK